MVTIEEGAALEAALDGALAKLQRMAGGQVAPHGARVQAERLYGQAYQNLVKAGLRPQIRGKYRGAW